MTLAKSVLEKLDSVTERTYVTVSCTPEADTAKQAERVEWLNNAGVQATLGASPTTDIQVPYDQGQKAVTTLHAHGVEATIAA